MERTLWNNRTEGFFEALKSLEKYRNLNIYSDSILLILFTRIKDVMQECVRMEERVKNCTVSLQPVNAQDFILVVTARTPKVIYSFILWYYSYLFLYFLSKNHDHYYHSCHL